jgi:membrane protein
MKKFTLYSQKVGFIGFMGFLLIVFLLMRDVENSFNYLWGIEKSRPVLRQVIRHAIFFVGLPILGVVLLTLKGWAGSLNLFHYWFFSSFLPFAILWAACSWMYGWVPNTRVNQKTAFWTGLLVALLLETARWAMNWYTLKVFHQTHVYGALWMFPVILIWFYLSWTVILFGAEVSFFAQQRRLEMAR